ncbi:hypothetical protein H257_13213 [Aphanomyces astaci]|uniref:HTH CENPB-type domain-containing protein n=1 Tax=Aphanomyces astaci TaxID=112090 RepID=W4FXQ8_APHAT|nr:hypothetical protein H257_13213 [Aphanomyces astaci]ETV71549.1 hypothetical protein H257_13213 [Aphanomyces astaci]|eukprot:XP_009838982.1 hypothetical protein H257_13213 [Aphanomyces astaci]
MDSSQMTMPQTKPRGRPRLKQGPTKPWKKYSNVHVSFAVKQAVIETFDGVGMAATLAKHFSHPSGAKLVSTRKKLYSWLIQRDHIRSKTSNPKTSRHLCSRAIGMATTLSKESKEQLAQLVNSMRTGGVPVTPLMIQVMALEMTIHVGLDESAFTASWSWLQGSRSDTSLPCILSLAPGKILKATVQRHWTSSRLVLLRCSVTTTSTSYTTRIRPASTMSTSPTKTLNSKGDHTIWTKCSGKTKNRATEMVMADSTSKQYPLFLVLKTKASKIKSVVQKNLVQRQGLGKNLWKDARLRQMWVAFFPSILRQVLRSKAKKETLQLEAPKRPTPVQWITESWSDLDEFIIMNGFDNRKIVVQEEEIAESPEDAGSAHMLSELVARCAIDDTIDPMDDMDVNSNDE